MRLGIANACVVGGAPAVAAVRVGEGGGVSAGGETCQPRRTQM